MHIEMKIEVHCVKLQMDVSFLSASIRQKGKS